jgi:hypothetical protein
MAWTMMLISNHVDVLDPALSRPGEWCAWEASGDTMKTVSSSGRFDVWVEFRNSTKAQVRTMVVARLGIQTHSLLQAHDLFLNFFPEHKVQPTDPLASRLEKHNLPQNDRRLQLADAFAAAVPEEKYSVAALQGFLMGFKGQPERAVEAFPMWDETKHKSGSSHDAPQPVSTPGM